MVRSSINPNEINYFNENHLKNDIRGCKKMAVIVKSAIRAMMKGRANVGEDFLKRLDADVVAMVRRAADRAKANGRKTLKARDC